MTTAPASLPVPGPQAEQRKTSGPSGSSGLPRPEGPGYSAPGHPGGGCPGTGAATGQGAAATADAAGTAGGECDPRWLDDEEQHIWRAYLNATMLLDDHLDRQLQRDAAMPHVYYGLLAQLSEAPRRRLRMTELARRAKITRSRLSHAVARLEANGWVRREDCPSDKRGQFAVLTKQGRRVLERAAPGHVEAVRQALFNRLSREQQRALGEIMQVIAEGLEPSAGADLPWLR